MSFIHNRDSLPAGLSRGPTQLIIIQSNLQPRSQALSPFPALSSRREQGHEQFTVVTDYGSYNVHKMFIIKIKQTIIPVNASIDVIRCLKNQIYEEYVSRLVF